MLKPSNQPKSIDERLAELPRGERLKFEMFVRTIAEYAVLMEGRAAKKAASTGECER